MIVSTETLGPNSYRIRYTDMNDGNSVLMQELLSVILDGDHGWEMFSDSNPATGSPKVIRSLCEDGTTYKYVRLSYSTSGVRHIALEVGDGAVNTTLDNVCLMDPAIASNYGSVPAINSWQFHQELSDFSAMYVFVTPRYLILFSEKRTSSGYVRYGNNFGTWTGCLEFREDLGLSGPPFAWTDGHHFSGNVAELDTTHADTSWKTWAFSLPRTGSLSVNNQYRYEGTSIGHVMNSLLHFEHVASTTRACNSGNYNWTYAYNYRGVSSEKDALSKANDIPKPLAIVPHAVEHRSTPQLRGPFFGIKKALGGYGVIMTEIPVKVDSDLFPSKKGLPVNHIMIGSAYDRYLIPL